MAGYLGGSGVKRDQVDKGVFAPEGEFLDLLVLDHHPNVGVVGLGQRRLAFHLHEFRDFTDLQAQIDTSDLVHLEDDSRDLLLLETDQLAADGIAADRQEADVVVPGIVRDGVSGQSRVHIGDHDLHARKHASRFVGHRPHHLRRRPLSERAGKAQQKEEDPTRQQVDILTHLETRPPWLVDLVVCDQKEKSLGCGHERWVFYNPRHQPSTYFGVESRSSVRADAVAASSPGMLDYW